MLYFSSITQIPVVRIEVKYYIELIKVVHRYHIKVACTYLFIIMTFTSPMYLNKHAYFPQCILTCHTDWHWLKTAIITFSNARLSQTCVCIHYGCLRLYGTLMDRILLYFYSPALSNTECDNAILSVILLFRDYISMSNGKAWTLNQSSDWISLKTGRERPFVMSAENICVSLQWFCIAQMIKTLWQQNVESGILCCVCYNWW